MNDFFKFDDKRIIFTLWLIVAIILLLLSIYAIKIIELFLVVIFVLLLVIIISTLSFNEGIHFNYEKEKIIIVKGMMIKIIEMKDVQYFVLKEIPKKRKGNIVWMFIDPIERINIPPKYVYNKGKVFNIIFYKKDKTKIEIYYGWLYKTNSEERITRQLEKFGDIKEKFINFQQNKKNVENNNSRQSININQKGGTV